MIRIKYILGKLTGSCIWCWAILIILCFSGCDSTDKRGAIEDYLWDKSYDISETDIVIIIDEESSENCRFGLYIGLFYAEVNRKFTLILVGDETEIRSSQVNYLNRFEKGMANEVDVIIDETNIWSFYKKLGGFKSGDIILAGLANGKVFKGRIMNDETYTEGTTFPDDVLRGL